MRRCRRPTAPPSGATAKRVDAAIANGWSPPQGSLRGRLRVRDRGRRPRGTTTVTLPSAPASSAARPDAAVVGSRSSSAVHAPAGERVAERSTGRVAVAVGDPDHDERAVGRATATRRDLGLERAPGSSVVGRAPRAAARAVGGGHGAEAVWSIHTATELPSASVATSGADGPAVDACGSASSHAGAASAGRSPAGTQRRAGGGGRTRRGGIARLSRPGGGTQPRLRRDRRVAYSRLPMARIARLIAVLLLAALLARCRARRRARRHARGALLADALRGRRLGRARGRPRHAGARSTVSARTPRAPPRR